VELKTNIQKLRERKRYSRPQLAERSGVSWETIKAYEVKGAFPSIQVAFKIANALECKVDDLFDMDILSEEDKHELDLLMDSENEVSE
jgi:DNA-binding XRE family transcriptional regulator